MEKTAKLHGLSPELIIECIKTMSPLIKADKMNFGEWEGVVAGKESGESHDGKHLVLADIESPYSVQGIMGEVGEEETEALTVLMAVFYNHKDIISEALELYDNHTKMKKRFIKDTDLKDMKINYRWADDCADAEEIIPKNTVIVLPSISEEKDIKLILEEDTTNLNAWKMLIDEYVKRVEKQGEDERAYFFEGLSIGDGVVQFHFGT